MAKAAEPPKKTRRKGYYCFALVAVLVVVLAVAFLRFQSITVQDPLLYNDALTVQLATDKEVYRKGEDVVITACVINGKNEPVNCTTAISYKVFDAAGQEVYSCITLITLPIPVPTYQPHSKYSYSPLVWSQKNSNYTQVEAGNYTIQVSLEHGTAECKIQITD